MWTTRLPTRSCPCPNQGRSGWWAGGQTRPNLKVQDGCGNRCSFCIIPATRGHSRSLSLEACLRNVQAFAAGGGTELVLSGINLGRWGRDLTPQRTLEELVGAILLHTALAPPASQLHRADGLDARAAGPVSCPLRYPRRSARAPCPSPVAIRIRRHSARHAPPLSPLALCGETAPDSREHAGRGDRRGRDGGLSGRERSPL